MADITSIMDLIEWTAFAVCDSYQVHLVGHIHHTIHNSLVVLLVIHILKEQETPAFNIRVHVSILLNHA